VPATGEGDGPRTELEQVLSEARQAGFLGPGPLGPQYRHAEGFAALARRLSPTSSRLLDLGSGGGLPGLVVALAWPEATVVLLDGNRRRAGFLAGAVERLDLGGRVNVVHQRAEVAGRDPQLRAGFAGVLARSFGPPAVLAECAAPFLRVGGWVVVSEPPAGPSGTDEGSGRWPAEPLAQVGLVPDEVVQDEFSYQVLRQRTLCPERYPRRDGVPAKRPLF
jgi:16S rRNA (guanine527-N7)-methyltransferase